jgi:PII-like signaling protein
MKLKGRAKMLRVYFGEDDRWKDKPLYRAVVEKCRALDFAGLLSFAESKGIAPAR